MDAVRSLVAQGLNDCEIARRTAVPRGTVRDWRGGRIAAFAADSDLVTCRTCGASVGPAEVPPQQYAYLLGLYLGDGCISKGPRGVYRLRVFLDSRYPEIIERCAAAMRRVIPTSKARAIPMYGAKAMEVQSYAKHWPCLFPQHGPGPKHERRIALAPWQGTLAEDEPEALVKGLIESDGCRYVNRVRHGEAYYSYVSYSFTNASADIRYIFGCACDQLGIGWRRSSERIIAITRRQDVARLDEFVGPKR